MLLPRCHLLWAPHHQRRPPQKQCRLLPPAPLQLHLLPSLQALQQRLRALLHHQKTPRPLLPLRLCGQLQPPPLHPPPLSRRCPSPQPLQLHHQHPMTLQPLLQQAPLVLQWPSRLHTAP